MPMTVPGALAYLQGLVPALGWTLAHFLWQGALVAFALQLALKACRTARARHDWALAALVLMAILPVVTFAWLQAGVRIVLVPKGFPGLTPAGERWETFAVGAWLAGVAILAARMAGGLLLVERLRRTAAALPPEWVARCRLLEERLAAPLKVAFAQSEAVAMPIVAGWLKPMVLVPAGFLTRLPPAELEALILHELAHVRRLDAFANLIQSVAETLLFYHPAVWWVSRRVRLERELCCDDLAAAAIRDPALYVRALQSLDALRASPYGVLAANGEGDLKRRAARILGLAVAPERPALSRTAAVAVLALGAVAMTHGAAVRAEPGPAAVNAVATRATAADAQASAQPAAAFAPIVERSAPAPIMASAPRIVLAAADVATPVPLGPAQPVTPLADPPLAEPAAPAPATVSLEPPAAKPQKAAFGATLSPLVVSPIKPVKPDAHFVVGGFHDRDSAPVQLWPERANYEGFDAHVVMSCYVDAHGFAERCAVVSNSRPQRDFGETALALRPTLRVKPAEGPDGPIASTQTIALDFIAGVTTSNGGNAATSNGGHGSAGGATVIPGGASGGGAPKADMLSDPHWVRAAGFDDVAASAKPGEAEGLVVEACAVQRDGSLASCYPLVGDRADLRRAAFALTRKFRLASQQAGLRKPGRSLWVAVPFRFPTAKEAAERTVTAPVWVTGFDPAKAPAVFPPEAVSAGVTSGHGLARCTVGPDGALTGCVAEAGAEPGGFGFSSAAARLASTLKMSLWSSDGAPVAGGVVDVPIRLNLRGTAASAPGN